MFDPAYEEQVRLLLRCLPAVAAERGFALKGGTALNLFVRDMPRVSVDIDLTFLPVGSRDAALQEIEAALLRIQACVIREVDGARVQESKVGGRVTKLTIATPTAQIKIEPNTVLRGALGPAVERDLCATAQERFEMFCAVPVLSDADLYGGKLCAALDRQHPRDMFDVKLLLSGAGITPPIRRAFVVYLASHDRPMHELLMPKLKDMSAIFESEFAGMARVPVPLDELVHVQAGLARSLVDALDEDERAFLVSLKSGAPEWHRLGIDGLEHLPALQWKLLNIRRMDARRREEQLGLLKDVLSG